MGVLSLHPSRRPLGGSLQIEPLPTALALVVFASLLAVSVLFSRASGRLGVPVALFFIVLGIAAGSEGVGGIEFEDYHLTFRVGTVALVLILFDGGLNTSFASFARSIKPAALLATVGVVLTAALLALTVRLLGLPWPEALLVGAVVSSTDAAAVFAVLRGSGLQLKKRVGTTLELESGLNDPVAVILTVSATEAVATGQELGVGLLGSIGVQMVVGGALGVLFGYAARAVFARLRLQAGGLYPVLTIALALFAFGVPTLFLGSGFLAVYVAATILGNGNIPYRTGVLRVHDAIAWFCQITMFLLLGLLAFPSRLAAVAGTGLLVGLTLALVVRPLAVIPLLLPFRFSARELVFVGWVGLRGAVPIILATIPVLARVEGGHRIFDIVFFIVVVSAFVPGSSVGWLARRLGLQAPDPPPPRRFWRSPRRSCSRARSCRSISSPRPRSPAPRSRACRFRPKQRPCSSSAALTSSRRRGGR